MTKERLEQIRLEVNFLDCHPWDDETQGMMIELLAELDRYKAVIEQYANHYNCAFGEAARNALGEDK